MCVAPPTQVGAWSMAVLLGQPFEYYYLLLHVPSLWDNEDGKIVHSWLCYINDGDRIARLCGDSL